MSGCVSVDVGVSNYRHLHRLTSRHNASCLSVPVEEE